MKTTSRANKLKDLTMPKKTGGEAEADTDLSMLNGGAEEAPEASADAQETPGMGDDAEMGDTAGDMADEADKNGTLEHLSDDDLLGELKRRGLMSAHSPLGKAAESDIVASMDNNAEEGSPAEESMESPEEESTEDEEMMKPLAKKLAKSRKK